MRVLVIGGGGREHALAWRLARDAEVERVVVAPGNAGIKGPKIALAAADDIPGWLALAAKERVALTVVGPERPLVDGVVDAFEEQGLLILGPSRAAARLEGSKIFAKRLMAAAGVPTAAWRAAGTIDEVLAFVGEHPGPYAIKADGLAAGKGVERAADGFEASEIARSFLTGWHGEASRELVIERWLDGTECSLLALCDGEKIRLMPACRDYKRLRDNDQGQNTGSMGSFCPLPLDAGRIAAKVIDPILAALAAQGTAYRGFLYAGLMLDAAGRPFVLEYNCRLGDPEAQVQLPLWQGPFARTLLAAAEGRLGGQPPISWADLHAVCVVLAARGYPDCPATGWPVTLPPTGEHQHAFAAALRRAPGSARLVAAGGRVLGLTGLGASLAQARARAYELAAHVRSDDSVARSDIAREPQAEVDA